MLERTTCTASSFHLAGKSRLAWRTSDTGWTAATAFEEIIAGSGPERTAIERHIPHFELRLIDVSDGRASGLVEEMLTALSRVVLWALSVAHDDERLEREIHRFDRALAEVLAAPNGRAALEVLFRYLSATHRMPGRKIGKLLSDAAGPEAQEKVMDFMQELRDEGRIEGKLEGRIEGKLEGRIEGKLEGRAEALLDLLAARFGKVPAAVKTRVQAADKKALSQWTLRVLTAATLAEVLDGEEAAAKPATRSATRRSAAASSRRSTRGT